MDSAGAGLSCVRSLVSPGALCLRGAVAMAWGLACGVVVAGVVGVVVVAAGVAGVGRTWKGKWRTRDCAPTALGVRGHDSGRRVG
jgi:hypothetical protein